MQSHTKTHTHIREMAKSTLAIEETLRYYSKLIIDLYERITIAENRIKELEAFQHQHQQPSKPQVQVQ